MSWQVLTEFQLVVRNRTSLERVLLNLNVVFTSFSQI